MELRFTSKEKAVGLFMIVISLAMLATVFVLGRGKDWFRSYVRYYTVFSETYNLSDYAAVKMSKAEIGKVKKISLYGDKVKVEIAVLKDYASRIRTDSIATVESPTFIGSEYISIKPGSMGATPVPEDGEIRSEAKKSIDDIMAEFQVAETAKKVIKIVQDLSDTASELRNPEGPLFAALHNANQTLSHLEVVSRDIKDGKGPVGDVLRSEAMVQSIRRDVVKLEKILSHIEKTTENAPGMVEELRGSIRDIKQIIANIEKGSEDVPELTKATRRGINEARDGIKNIDNVVRAVQKYPFIAPKIAPAPQGECVDAGLRK
jgi:phospholipid/cholesterol/gamma-HCH transport system substrate-binding protein